MECKICHHKPLEIEEYVEIAEDNNGFPNSHTPEEAVLNEEGTLNHITEMFYCTSCYIKIGMPLGTA